MTQFTRRKFIATTALGTAAAMFPFSGYLFAEETRVRPKRLFAARADDARALRKSRGRDEVARRG